MLLSCRRRNVSSLWHSNKQAAVSPLQEMSQGLWHIQECSCSSGPHAWGEAIQQDGNLAFLQGHKGMQLLAAAATQTSQHIIGVLGWVLTSSQLGMHGASAPCT